MKDVANFVQMAVESSAFPVGAEQRLPSLRAYCFGEEGAQYRRAIGGDADPSVLAAGLWVLLRHEYAALIAGYSSPSRSGAIARQAAFWRLHQVARKFLDYSLEQGLAGQNSWAFRRASTLGYLEEVRTRLTQPISLSDAEDIIQRELSATFTPTGTAPVSREIQSSFQNLVRTAESASLFAAAARLQAIQSLQQIYGPAPDAQRKAVEPQLGEDERPLVYSAERYARIKTLLTELPTGSQVNPTQDVSLLGDYGHLRQQLGFGAAPTPRVTARGRPSPTFAEAFFHNERREKTQDPEYPSIEKIRALFAEKINRSLADPLADSIDLSSYNSATRETQTLLTEMAVGRDKITGIREKTQLDLLSRTYPTIAGASGELKDTVPWFNDFPVADLVLVRTDVVRVLKGDKEDAKLFSVLAREPTTRDLATKTTDALFADLFQKLKETK
jgi:hypothetical protein